MDTKDQRVPATIRNHPAVRYAVPGEVEGSDYRYFIELHRGWMFENGAKAGGTGGGFNRVADFKYANPVRQA
jgi:hypothetical protein